MAKYKVGDKVRVRSDLVVNDRYFMEDGAHDSFIGEMDEFSGKLVTIEKFVRGKYKIKEDDELYYWTDEMFEGLADAEFHVFDTVKHRKYGIGTVIEIMSAETIKVDFDNWNEDFLYIDEGNNICCSRASLTLVQAYSPN